MILISTSQTMMILMFKIGKIVNTKKDCFEEDSKQSFFNTGK